MKSDLSSECPLQNCLNERSETTVLLNAAAQIGHYVFDMLEPDSQPQRAIAQTAGQPLGRVDLGMRGTGRMGNRAFDIAQIRSD